MQARGEGPILDHWVTDVARSPGRFPNTKYGRLSALTTTVKLYDWKLAKTYDGYENLAFQGFNLSLLNLEGPPVTHALMTHLAGQYHYRCI